MPNDTKTNFLEELINRCGQVIKLDRSQSLFEICDSGVRIYIRYSKVHPGERTFYGLREDDLRRLEGHPSLICFLWKGQIEPLFLPYEEYEEVFLALTPASDGQHKSQIFLHQDGTELYIPKAGRFNVEGYIGWETLEILLESTSYVKVPNFSHEQMQTLLGSIGSTKGFDIWIPQNNRTKLDWSLTPRFECRDILPHGFERIEGILQEVDVIWIQRGSSELRALYEVEHTTRIYPALLRFNDIHLVAPNQRPGFHVVAKDVKNSLFVRQINRPTFQTSGLSELCTFRKYTDVFIWFNRLK
jgi:hypothetical protein